MKKLVSKMKGIIAMVVMMIGFGVSSAALAALPTPQQPTSGAITNGNARQYVEQSGGDVAATAARVLMGLVFLLGAGSIGYQIVEINKGKKTYMEAGGVGIFTVAVASTVIYFLNQVAPIFTGNTY